MTPTALIERCRSHLVWEAWTDFGSVGAGRRAILTQIDNFRQGLGHLRVDPTDERRQTRDDARPTPAEEPPRLGTTNNP